MTQIIVAIVGAALTFRTDPIAGQNHKFIKTVEIFHLYKDTTFINKIRTV
ncbi:hypothetical protein [Chamaesiphon sp. OTE_75_metabat_556]|nr:hypothetical protein [Chamaesiphon sp. OTE_75_metabat_556]